MKNIPKAVSIPEPPTTPVRPVEDVYHGVTIIDSYRWLEDGTSPEVAAWTESHNARTSEVMEQLPQKKALSEKLTSILSLGVLGTPAFHGHRLFYTMKKAGANQPVLCVRELSGSSTERVLVDPNLASDAGLLALDWWYPSDDGSMLAYGCSVGGDEWSVLRVLDVESGEDLRDRIERARMASVTWDKDNRGFYYCRYPKPGDVSPGEENYHHHLFHHRLGEDPAKDPKIFGEGRAKDEFYHTEFSDTGKYLVLTVGHGWNSNDLFFREETGKGTGSSPIVERAGFGPVGEGASFIPIVEGIEAHFSVISVLGDTAYVLTDSGAPHGRICAVDLRSPSIENWREITSEDASFTIADARICAGCILVTGLTDASSRLYSFDLNGSGKREIALPVLGTVTAIAAQDHSPEAFFRFESFAIAPVIYRMYVDSHAAPQVFLSSDQPEGAETIGVEQVFYRSKDGTRIPMFILEKKGLRVAGPRPTVLTGYGGFNLAKTPAYSGPVMPWLQAGGVFAVANLRGGNEYGEEWHRAGMRENKQNVFDDFIAAGHYLVDSGITDKTRLGIWGRSNGGLLVGAALTQKPDLFAAVACGVPLLDMIRYHKFLIAYLWTSEYGNPDDPKDFPYLYLYSPYHKVRAGLEYPAVYFYTALSDSRVDPMHARKMTARLLEVRKATGWTNPVLLRVESEAGHGVGKPVTKVVEEQAEMWAFLAWRLGLAV